MAVELKVQGMDQIKRKLDQLSSPKKAKQIARKAGRQSMNIVRDAARSNAKAIDDPETREMIHKNIAVQAGKTRNPNEIRKRRHLQPAEIQPQRRARDPDGGLHEGLSPALCVVRQPRVVDGDGRARLRAARGGPA